MISVTKIDLSESDLLNLITSDLILTDQDELILKLKPNTQLEHYLSVGAEGSVFIEVDVTKSYLVKTKSQKYEVNSMIIRPKKDLTDFTALMNPIAEPMEVIPIVEPIEPEIFIPVESGTTVVFDHIYYASNSAEIKAGAAKELDALIRVMKENPLMKVQLSAHTDSRGKELYNQVLSEKRAASAKAYLVKAGIESDRVFTLGFGESRLRNHCSEGVKCTNEEHRYNRRTEVTIL
jgi:outer membrane protein OmpA-like peptidoglycan-associated protein